MFLVLSMSKILYHILTFIVACSFIGDDPYRNVRNESFTTGELLEYRIHYGFVTIGEGKIEVNPTLIEVNDRVCYQATVYGKTSGSFALAYKVRDTWRSFIDTSAIIPQQFYMHIHENKYRKEETVYFNHLKKTLRSEEKNQTTKEFTLPENVQDVVSGLYFLRTLDFNQLHPGDTISMPAFFDDKFFDFKVRYLGKGEVKTTMGRIKAIQLTPVMPSNGLFKGENAIRMWLSDDMNKIPVKVEADLFLGAIELELKKMKGAKQALHFYE